MCNILFYRCLWFLKIVKIKKIAADLNKKTKKQMKLSLGFNCFLKGYDLSFLSFVAVLLQ